MTVPERRLLVIAPPEPWVPEGSVRVGRWRVAATRVDRVDDRPGEWDVVAFRVDAVGRAGAPEVLEALRRIAPEATFLPVARDPDLAEALLFLKNGAYEYLEEPLEPAEFRRALQEALENREAFQEILALNRTLEAQARQLRREKEELERRNRELEAASLLARDLALSLEPDQVVERLASRLRETFPGREVRIGLFSRRRRSLRMVFPPGSERRAVRLDTPEHRAWLRSLLRNDPGEGAAGGAVPEALAPRPGHACAVVPMAARGRPVGLLWLESDGPAETLPRDELQLLHIFADTAAIALENARLYQAMRDLSVRDELTGLYNRRYFQERFRAEWDHATRHGMPLSLLLVDIDHFKRLNDGTDHLTGDEALRRVARTLARNTRGIDTVARYGGEEFVVLLPRTDGRGARVVAEKLRRVVLETPFPGEHAVPGGKLTISVGGAAYPGAARSPEELLARADHALYRAKQAGRNRTCLWNGDGESAGPG